MILSNAELHKLERHIVEIYPTSRVDKLASACVSFRYKNAKITFSQEVKKDDNTIYSSDVYVISEHNDGAFCYVTVEDAIRHIDFRVDCPKLPPHQAGYIPWNLVLSNTYQRYYDVIFDNEILFVSKTNYQLYSDLSECMETAKIKNQEEFLSLDPYIFSYKTSRINTCVSKKDL